MSKLAISADSKLRAHEARERALGLSFGEYAGTVLEFLDEADREVWSKRWEDQQLLVAALAEAILKQPVGLGGDGDVLDKAVS